MKGITYTKIYFTPIFFVPLTRCIGKGVPVGTGVSPEKLFSLLAPLPAMQNLIYDTKNARKSTFLIYIPVALATALHLTKLPRYVHWCRVNFKIMAHGCR